MVLYAGHVALPDMVTLPGCGLTRGHGVIVVVLGDEIGGPWRSMHNLWRRGHSSLACAAFPWL